jgi:S1-C subfamily serine protease
LLGFGNANRVDTEAMLDVSVSVRTISHVHIDKFGDSVWESGSGSGFLVDSERCYVWTNHHVIDDAAIVEVFPRNWNRSEGIPATVVNSTPRADLAILRMSNCEGMPEAVLGDSGLARPGDETYAVGNPLGRNPHSISRGIISHTERYLHGASAYLQTDAAINPGNSGGALFNRHGDVIGINTAIASSKRGATGIGYAVPINVAKAVVEELRKGPPSWGDAGISDLISSLTPDEAEVFRVPDGHGAIIITADPTETPSAGMLFAHDVIYRINGVGVSESAQAMRMISSYRPGDKVTFDLIRSGEAMTLPMVLGEGWKRDAAPVADYYDGYLGMSLEMWNGEEDERGQFASPVITKVQSLGPAHKASISSSQRGMGFKGPFLMPYQIDVKLVTGVVFAGEYHAIEDIQDIEDFAAIAYEAHTPMLLEIELWARANPMNAEANLKRVDTAFFRIVPAATTVPAKSDSGATATTLSPNLPPHVDQEVAVLSH